MLKYIEFCVSHMEVPGESCLCIYICGCTNRCRNCHYPELQSAEAGERLEKYFNDIVDLYREQISCVCFMGEGECTQNNQKELVSYAQKLNAENIKSCLYSGRDCEVEDWMKVFDFIKLGSYKEEYGSLSEKTTNQRLFMKSADGYENITYRFWV